MNLHEFVKEVISIAQPLHSAMVKSHPPFLAKGKISFTQMVILELVKIKKECKMSDISDTMRVTRGAITGIVDRMIKGGLIKRQRSEKDRRVVYVILSIKGRDIASRILKFKETMLSGMFKGLSEKERMQYLYLLKKISKNIVKPKAN